MDVCPTCGTEAGAGYFCSCCGHPLSTEAARRYPPPPPGDPDLGHFLRYLGVSFLGAFADWVLVGLVWMAHICNRTGYRKRDLLLVFVPVAGAIVHTRALWRYTARDVYWTPREDRPSDLLRGWQRPWAIGAGWALLPLSTVALILAAVVSTFGWSDADREELVRTYEEQGFDLRTAECIAEEIIEELPDGEDVYSFDEISDATGDAIGLCA